MKLSKLVLSAILLMGVSAHADLKSEFERAQGIARSKAMQVESQKRIDQGKQIRAERMREVVQKLQTKGMNIRSMQIESVGGSLVLCGTGGCSAEYEDYIAKSGNIICSVRYQIPDSTYKKTITESCYDVTNPEPTGTEIPVIEIVST